MPSSLFRFRSAADSIVVVTGLPRSGTSMAMRMLDAGGLPLLTDDARAPDVSNPHGYFEFEPVTRLHQSEPAPWLDEARGKAVKIVSFQLTWLPDTYRYRVIFMQRDLREVIASQESMLQQRGEAPTGATTEATLQAYEQHLGELDRFLARRKCFTTLRVSHSSVLADPRHEAGRMAEFIGRPLDLSAMAAAVDPALYRSHAQ